MDIEVHHLNICQNIVLSFHKIYLLDKQIKQNIN